MTTGPVEIEAVKDDGARRQWARGPFYRKDGRKLTASPKAFVWATVLLFGAGAVVSLVTATGTASHPPPREDPSRLLGMPGEGGGESVVLPPAETFPADKPATEPTSGQRPRGEPRPAPRLGRLQLFSRPGSADVPPGSMFKARLVSGASNGPVRAEVTEPLVVDGETRIPVGVLLVGTGQSTEQRLFIRFTQLIQKTGAVEEIQAQACDAEDQTVGLKGTKVGHYVAKLAASAALNFAGGLSEGLQESEGQGGAVVKKPTVKNALLNGASRAALEQAKDTMSSAKSETPIIEVPAGTEIYVLTTGVDL